MPNSQKSQEYLEMISKGDAQRVDQSFIAISYYERAFKINPDYSEPLVKILKLYQFEYDDLERALDVANRLVEEFPDDATSYFMRGEILSQNNQHDDAVDDFSIALEIDPNRTDVCKESGFSLAALGRHKSAAKMYWRAVKLHPDDSEAVYRLCSELEELKEYQYAIKVLKAHQPLCDMYNYEIYRHMGRVYGLLGNMRYSFVNYAKSIVLNKPGKDGTPLMEKKYQDIMAAQKEIAKMDPSNPDSFYSAGLLMLDAGWTHTALNIIETGTLFNPMSWSYECVGDIYVRYGDILQAIDYYKRAINMVDGLPADFINRQYASLIRCLFGCGLFRECSEYVKIADSRGLTHPDIIEYGHCIRNMKGDFVEPDLVADGLTIKSMV